MGKAGGGNREMLISKALSRLLRHAAKDAGLEMDAAGYARADLVVSFALLATSSCYLRFDVCDWENWKGGGCMWEYSASKLQVYNRKESQEEQTNTHQEQTN